LQALLSRIDFPKLFLLKVGNRDDSTIYIRNKLKSAAEVGINAMHYKFDRYIREADLLNEIDKLNNDSKIHGIIVQLPFDCEYNLDSDAIINNVNPRKDVDGLHFINAGKILHGDLNEAFIPCTPKGCLELIKSTNINIEGKNAVVLGRSKLVGSPMANLLRINNATVTICHSKTQNLPDVCRSADILVVAIGKSRFVKGDWIKPGAVVIDCGINSYKG
jgi:methylenetetrahydrofolate dehydrogenase (NADP+)/methenyltetrahydrofolate cyclohydrolase/formyltetrahydrofolate synthetase